MVSYQSDVAILYDNRFKGSIEKRKRLWMILCSSFFQKFMPTHAGSTILDIGAGFGEFINNIEAARKIAVDLNEETSKYLSDGVEFIKAPGMNLDSIPNYSADVIFMSNFLEHLDTKSQLLQVCREAYRILKSGGLIMILGPNIKYAYKEYWDFFDHHIPLTHKSVQEVLELVGFKVTSIIPKFLPYSTNSRFPQWPIVIKTYLRMPILWHFFGKQMFVLAKKADSSGGRY